MSKISLIILIIITSTIGLLSQTINDVQILDEINITAPKINYGIGYKIDTISKKQYELISSKSLSETISKLFPIYIKKNAGGLATIKFRGTSPNHTAILFHGVNINSLTLGHSNIANIPMFLFDNIKIQYGGSSSLYGSDAIGGTIQLDTKPNWQNGFKLKLQHDISSFNNRFYGAALNATFNKIQFITRIYETKNENRIPFINTTVKDFENNTFVKDTLRNSKIKNYGFLQELMIKTSHNSYAYFTIWYENDWHQIQPNMSTNYYGGVFTEIKNENLRAISGWEWKKLNKKLSVSYNVIKDYQLYNKKQDQTIQTLSHIQKINYEQTINTNNSISAGINIQEITPKVYAYKNIEDEYRQDAYISHQLKIFNDIKLSTNIRESKVSNRNTQFTPAINLEYLAYHTSTNSLKIKANVGRSYKVPTFNDRFWYPLGNPDLLPEKGINYELNTLYKNTQKNSSLNISLTGYYMLVNNWIEWIPKGADWRPENISKVQCAGLETKFMFNIKYGKLKITPSLNYSLNSATTKNNSDNTKKRVGRQLIYTPLNILNSSINAEYKKLNLNISSTYTGNVYLNYDTNETLDGYLLINASLQYNLKFQNHSLNIIAQANNILDKAYQVEKLFVMPGRNFTLSLRYLFNNYKNN